MRISDWSSDVCSSDLLCAQPNEATLPGIDIGFVGIGVARAHPAVQAVGRNHEIGLVFFSDLLVVGNVGFKNQLHAQLFAARLQDIQQLLAAYAYKAVAAAAHAVAFIVAFDVVPMIEGSAALLCGNRIGLLQVFQSGIGENQ